MSSFGQKLARLAAPSQPPKERERSGEASEKSSSTGDASDVSSTTRPALDELRDRIASILARSKNGQGRPLRPAPPPIDHELDELPFLEEETPLGPLHLARKKVSPAARIGSAPLHPAALADPSMLALLALDPTLLHCDPRRALYLDTETTGLSGGTGTVAFLLGLAYFDDHENAFVLEQVMVKKLGEEAPMLAHLARRLEEASMIVTFNGKAFDWPLLRARVVMNRMPTMRELPHLDLLHVGRRIHKSRLTSCNLRTIEEEVLGLVRIDDVAGADIAACFMHYLRTRDASVLSGVVEHNATDVLSMVALTGFYGEPIGSLGASDLACVANTLRRAGDLERAHQVVEIAVERMTAPSARASDEARSRAIRVRGDIAKARGDKARALADYERALAEADHPSLRLELAKLYEHFEKSFDKAMGTISFGTSEAPIAHEKRRARLARRLEITRSSAEPAVDLSLAPSMSSSVDRPSTLSRESSGEPAKQASGLGARRRFDK